MAKPTFFMPTISRLITGKPDYIFNPEIKLTEEGVSKPVLEHLKEISLYFCLVVLKGFDRSSFWAVT